jgi:hypothetical protein
LSRIKNLRQHSSKSKPHKNSDDEILGKRDRIRADEVSQDSDTKFQAKMTKLSNSKPTAVRDKTPEPKKKTTGKPQPNLSRKKSNARFDGSHL